MEVELQLTWWWVCDVCDWNNYAWARLSDYANTEEDAAKWAEELLETDEEERPITYVQPEKVTCEGCLSTFKVKPV